MDGSESRCDIHARGIQSCGRLELLPGSFDILQGQQATAVSQPGACVIGRKAHDLAEAGGRIHPRCVRYQLTGEGEMSLERGG